MKTINRKFQLLVVALATIGIFTACSKDDDDPSMEPMNIFETASSDNQFSILVSAIEKAGLVSTLQGEDPFTVFAPTNDAFNALFAQIGVTGIDDLSADALRPILLNHVISGDIRADDITPGYASTVNDAGPDKNYVKVLINKSSTVTVDGSTVITADMTASNGTIHVIDKVILPANVVGHAINNPDFSILVEAVVKADLVDALSTAGPFTVFAPTNQAFTDLFNTLGVSGIADLTAEQLTPILLYHVVPGNIVASQVTSGNVPTLKEGSTISVEVSGMGVKLNGTANVVATDVQGTNGVVHAIDAVILP